jgi:aminoglycoside phosphotransferase (APT) family kinase protein
MPEQAIDTDAFTEKAARRALIAACDCVGIGADAELIRVGSNAVFRLNDDTIVRVAPSLACSVNAARQVAVSRWLTSLDYSVVKAANLEQPVEADGRVITFWESVAPETVYAPIEQVAALIRQLHRLQPPATLHLPPLRPFGVAEGPVPKFDGLTKTDAVFLRQRYVWARNGFDQLAFPLGRGVIHGDANVGNVLLNTHGQAVLIDLDSFSIGPREWDLIQTALFADRLGWHTAEEYRTFVEVYGYDITKWDGYETLADMREVAMTAWLAKKAAADEKAAAEAHKRITAMRTGGSRRDWGAY